MIIKTDALKTAADSYAHIFHVFHKPEQNEEINIIQGDEDDIRDFYALARQKKCHDAVIHIKLSPDEKYNMNDPSWKTCINRIAGEFDCDPDNAVVVEHKKKGRVHRHIMIPAFDIIKNKKVSLSFSKYRSVAICKQLEHELGHDYTAMPDYMKKFVVQMLDERGFKEAASYIRSNTASAGVGYGPREIEIAKRKGYDIKELKEELQGLLNKCDGGKAYVMALQEAGFKLEKVITVNNRERWMLKSLEDPSFSIEARKVIGITKKQIEHIITESQNVDIQQEAKTPEATPEFSITREAKAINSRKANTSDRPERKSNPKEIRKATRDRRNTGNQTGYRKPERDAESNAIRRTKSNTSYTGMLNPDSSATGNSRAQTGYYDGKNAEHAERDNQSAKAQQSPSESISERFRKTVRHVIPKTPADQFMALYGLNEMPLELPRKYVFSVSPEEQTYDRLEYADIMFRHYHNRKHAPKNSLKFFELLQTDEGICYEVTTKQGEQFKDYGTKITSDCGIIKSSTASEIVRSAKAKGWTELNVTGTQEYKDELTIQAALQGIKTNHELSDKAQKRLNEIQAKFNRQKQQRFIQDNIRRQQRRDFEM